MGPRDQNAAAQVDAARPCYALLVTDLTAEQLANLRLTAIALQDLLDCLEEPEPDWTKVSDAWLDAVVEANGTPTAAAALDRLRPLLRLRDGEAMREDLRRARRVLALA